MTLKSLSSELCNNLRLYIKTKTEIKRLENLALDIKCQIQRQQNTLDKAHLVIISASNSKQYYSMGLDLVISEPDKDQITVTQITGGE